jgi:hypothetical protein
MTETTHVEPKLAPVAFSKQAVACLAGWLIPGAGHAVLGRYGRAVLIFTSISLMIVLGLAMHGHLYAPGELDTLFAFKDVLSKVYLVGQMGMGVVHPILRALKVGVEFQYKQPTYEYGTHFLVVAGLLNFLAVFDAFDIAKGRKA